MLTIPMPSLSILKISNILPNNNKWIFLKSSQKRLLKNAQDGISRPLGSREIEEIKVATVLRDTL